MTTTQVPCEAIQITGANGLDQITVFWTNPDPGRGHVTVICYGSAWTAYFGAMSGKTIQEFVAEAPVDYLVTKMGITPHLKARKQDNVYLGKIIRAVKESLKNV